MVILFYMSFSTLSLSQNFNYYSYKSAIYETPDPNSSKLFNFNQDCKNITPMNDYICMTVDLILLPDPGHTCLSDVGLRSRPEKLKCGNTSNFNIFKNYSKKKTRSISTTLSCMYTNATSLNNKVKWNEFMLLIQLKNYPHVICITETWFNINSLRQIQGYTIYYKDRLEIRGGGVAINIRNDINSYEIVEKKLIKYTNIEKIWCEVLIGK